jgi:formylglycine-generating enzyme required for sulfatase activity
MPRLCSSLLLSLGIASSASAVSMAWTPIGNPGNACDSQSQGCFGDVGYAYNIGTYEVTNAQYVEFLNEKAVSDPLELYSSEMGIMRFGGSGSYSYSAYPGREDMPVNYVSFYDALRFANWMNNGQGNSDTEGGAYTLLGGTPDPSNGTTVTRNTGAVIVLPSEDEWYKSAYYDASSASYFDYPTSSNTPTTCSAPTPTPNSANCGFVAGDLTAVGSYAGSASPFGTYDQGGNVFEWNEAFVVPGEGPWRNARAGEFHAGVEYLAAGTRGGFDPEWNSDIIGFRLVMIPEPSTGLLVIAGLLGLGGWRRARA